MLRKGLCGHCFRFCDQDNTLDPWSLILWVDALQEVKTAIKKIKQVDRDCLAGREVVERVGQGSIPEKRHMLTFVCREYQARAGAEASWQRRHLV